jgi:CBS domain-containing protein
MTVKLVRDLMHIGVTTCPAKTPLTDAVHILLRDGLESLVVLDENGHAVGLCGRREAVVAYGLSGVRVEGIEPLTVVDVMRPDIPEIPPDIPATAAAQLMLDQDVRDLYLLHHDGGISWPAAVLRFDDVLRYIVAEVEKTNKAGPALAA